jgi:hypothetical protein
MVPSERNKQKNRGKYLFVASLKVTYEKSRSKAGSGSIPKYHGSDTAGKTLMLLKEAMRVT